MKGSGIKMPPKPIKRKKDGLQAVFLSFRFYPLAEAGGFEPPVRLPVRQFSKLVVSATHPHFLITIIFIASANIIVCFDSANCFCLK